MIKETTQNYKCEVCNNQNEVIKNNEVINGYFQVVTTCITCNTIYAIEKEGLIQIEEIQKRRGISNALALAELKNKIEDEAPKNNLNENAVTKKSKPYFLMWLISAGALYAICAFTQWNIEIDEWSVTCRAAFGIGTVAIAAYSFYCFEND